MVLFDSSTPDGARAAGRMQSVRIAWLTTVAAEGMPQSSPVWFHWDGETILLYSRPNTPKVRNIEAQPQVAFHLEGDGLGGHIVTIEGTARIDPDAPAADAVPRYVEKYGDWFSKIDMDAATMAAAFSVAIRIRPLRARVWEFD